MRDASSIPGSGVSALNRYRAGASRLCAAVLAALALLGLPSRAVAGPLFLVGAQYGTPIRASAGAGVLLPFGDQSPNSKVHALHEQRSGLVFAGSVGTGGEQVAGGLGAILTEGSYFLTYGLDFRGTLTRTRQSPRGATPDSTYAGAEAGLMVSLVRFSAGYAHRIGGAAGPKANTFTWGVGLQLPLGW
jgi:hypothetical protein